MTEEQIKQIDDLFFYLYDFDHNRYDCVSDYCTRRHIPIYEYLDSILDMSENLGKEPMEIIRELFPDD